MVEEQYDKGMEYITSIQQDLVDRSFKMYTGHGLIDTILSNKINKAINNNIRVDVNGFIGDVLQMDLVDISILISNVVDNAIEACMNINANDIDKHITIDFQIRRDYLVVTIINSFQNNIKRKNGILRTIKKDKSQHGFGLLNVEHIVDKYNGYMNINYSDTLFTIKIMLCIY